MKNPKLSIIIASYNKKDLLRNCINSILKNTKELDFEIIAVDDCSSDNSVQMVKDEFKDKVKLIINKKNSGPIVANNKGIIESKGEYCLILDNDTIITNNVFKKMADFMEENPKMGVLGCKLTFLNGNFQKTCDGIFPPIHIWIRDSILQRLIPNNKITQVHKTTPEAHEKIQEVDNVKGACYMLRRKMLKEIGLIDEEYYMYVEENDLFFRMKKKGWKIFYVPYGPVMHIDGASGRDNKKKETADKFKLLAFQNTIRFYKKNYGFFSSLAYRVIMLLKLNGCYILKSLPYIKKKKLTYEKRLIPKLIKVYLSPLKIKIKEPELKN